MVNNIFGWCMPLNWRETKKKVNTNLFAFNILYLRVNITSHLTLEYWFSLHNQNSNCRYVLYHVYPDIFIHVICKVELLFLRFILALVAMIDFLGLEQDFILLGASFFLYFLYPIDVIYSIQLIWQFSNFSGIIMALGEEM